MVGAPGSAFPTDGTVDLDALLGASLAGSSRVRNAIALLGEGPWDPEAVPVDRRTPLGILVVEGVLARDLSVAGVEATELVGEGDVLDPWSAAPPDAFLPASVHWTVLRASRILVISPSLMREAAASTTILGGLYAGAARRAARLALSQAIAQLPRVELRLLALLWHLAGRWGRVGPSGVVVPLAFSHARLGRLVGARRPTVTLALRELAERGHVTRRPDGFWQLGESTPSMLEDVEDPPHRRPARRRRIDPSDPIDQMAAELRRNLRHVQEGTRQAQARLPAKLQRLAALRARSSELVRQSEALRAEVDDLRGRRVREADGNDGVDGDGRS